MVIPNVKLFAYAVAIPFYVLEPARFLFYLDGIGADLARSCPNFGSFLPSLQKGRATE